MENNSLEIIKDKRLSNFVVGYYVVQALNLLVKLVLGNFALWTPISRGVMILLLIIALEPLIKRNFKALFAAEITFVILFSYTLLFQYASLSEYKSIILNVFTVFIPMGIAVLSINDTGILLKRLYFAAWPTQFILLFVLFSRGNFDYSMIGGYALIFQTLIIFDHYIEKHKWYDLVMCIADLVVIFIYGSRGPLLCACVMIVTKVLFSASTNIKKKIGIIFSTCVLSGVIFLFYNNLINGLIKLTNIMGYSSRNLYLLLNGRISSESGREAIQSYYLQEIMEGPVLGHGIAGGWIAVGRYPHNIFIELLLSFGPVFGVLVSLCIIVLCYFAIKNGTHDKRRLCHVLFAYSIYLLLSDSFLRSPMFFMLIFLGIQSFPMKFKSGSKR